MNSETKKKNVPKKIISSVAWVLIAVLIAFTGYLMYCNASGNAAFVGKYAFIKIVTPSMTPEIPVDEYILVEKLRLDDVNSLKKGDVIVFHSTDPLIQGKLNTHRIYDIDTGSGTIVFTTKGDNNPVPDAYTVSASDVEGRYVKNLDAVTTFASFVTRKEVFLCLVIIPAFILLVICILDVIKKARQVKMDLLVEEEVKRLEQEYSEDTEQSPDDTKKE